MSLERFEHPECPVLDNMHFGLQVHFFNFLVQRPNDDSTRVNKRNFCKSLVHLNELLLSRFGIVNSMTLSLILTVRLVAYTPRNTEPCHLPILY